MDLIRIWRTALLGLVVLLASCSREHYRKSSDQEVYGLIREKTPLVPNMDRRFTLEQTNTVNLEGLPASGPGEKFLGAYGETETGAVVLTLQDALNSAVRQNRRYQSQKEDLYLAALGLTLARHEFTPIFSAPASIGYISQVTDAPPGLSDDLAESSQVTGSAGLGASWLIGNVGRVTAAFTTDALRFVVGDHSVAISSEVSATFARPLLRNAGFKLEMEQLTQAERDLLYDLRNFAQFRRDFSVEVATAYYGVLGSRDAVRNSYLNLQSSRINAERSRELAAEGRITQSDLGRLAQQELSTESAWINAVRNYKQELDSFKILLGLSVDAAIVLADSELSALRILDPNLSIEDSIRIALAARLDYANAKDRLADAVRKVDVAANFLKPQVDLGARGAVYSDPTTDNHFTLPDFDRYSWSAGLDIDPGLDRKAERNAYRGALINRNRAARQVEQQEDEIKLAVRSSWRTLEQAKSNFQISKIGVELAERRVEEQNLLAELGRAKAQDQVDAQNALIDSRNQLTQALVTHTIARLQFWNRLGILYIKDNGQWEETNDAQAQ